MKCYPRLAFGIEPPSHLWGSWGTHLTSKRRTKLRRRSLLTLFAPTYGVGTNSDRGTVAVPSGWALSTTDAIPAAVRANPAIKELFSCLRLLSLLKRGGRRHREADADAFGRTPYDLTLAPNTCVARQSQNKQVRHVNFCLDQEFCAAGRCVCHKARRNN